MKRNALILFVLSFPVLAACGAMDPSQEASAVRVNFEERVLGSQYEPTLAAVVFGPEVMAKKDRADALAKGIDAERIRLVEVARAVEEARLAEVARVEAEAAAEAERVRLEEARRMAAPVATRTNQSSGTRSQPTTVPASRGSSSSAPASTGSGACGGNLPPCSVMMKESGGDPQAVSPAGYCKGGDTRCHGKWQFDLDTWAGLGYSGKPEDHSEAVQDEAAAKLLARSGCGQWSTC